MLIIFSLICLLIVIGVSYRKYFTKDEEVLCYLLCSFAICLLTFCILIPLSDFKYLVETHNYTLIPLSQQTLITTQNRYGGLYYNYSYVIDNNIKIGTTNNFYQITDGKEPYVNIKKYASSLGPWGIGLMGLSDQEVSVYIPVELLKNVPQSNLVNVEGDSK